jgi:hypothetical protein
MIWDVLGRIKESGSRFLLATTHQGAPWTAREGLQAAQFAPVDLESFPLRLGPAIGTVAIPGGSRWPKSLSLYRI